MGLNNIDNLTAVYIDATAVIHIKGRGYFKNCPPMKQFIHHIIDDHTADRIWIDMSDCTGMDSTFMGVVAGISCLIKSKPEYQFKLINLSEKNRKLLSALGVDRVVDYSMSTTPEEQEIIDRPEDDSQVLDPEFTDKLEAAKTSLEAHETLVEINPDNHSKFRSVVEFLKEDVRALKGE